METNTPQAVRTEQQPAPPPPQQKRRRPGRRKKIVKNIIAIVISLAVVGVLVWFSYSVFYSEPPEYYLTGAIELWPEIKNEVTGWGWLNPAKSESVKVTQQGNVLEAYADRGMTVNEGDVLCVIDSSVIDKAIDDHLKRITSLDKDIADLEKSIDNVNRQLAEANAEQIAMRQAARMTAPFAGHVIDAPRLTIGEQITKGMQLGRLVDDSRMKLILYFSYGYENDIYIGQSCEVSVPSVMSTIPGRVTAIEKVRRVGAGGSVSFEVEITMDNPGVLVSEAPATATMWTSDDEEILPVEAGMLECFREVYLTVESHGPLKENNLRNYYSYKAGDLLLAIDFEPDTSIEDGYLLTIEGYRASIEGKEEEIAGILDSIDEEREKMEDLTIRAPISGTITYSDLEWGMKITETNFATINIAQLGTLTMQGMIGQNEIHNFKVGMEVDVLVWTEYGETRVTGVITEIDTSAQQEGSWAQYPALISIDNSMGQIMEGSSGNFSAKTAYAENALVVPIQAVKNVGKGEYVFLQPKDGKAPENAEELDEGIVPPGFYAIPVKCGITNGRFIQITEGLLPKWGEEGWKVFTQKSEIEPSPEPSSHYEGDNDDPDYISGYDDGYEAGLEAGKSGDGEPGGDFYEGGDKPMPMPGGDFGEPGVIEDGYYDEDGNWVPNLPADGYYDEDGNWIPNSPEEDGYYDEDGNWIPNSPGEDGYYDEDGNWVPNSPEDGDGEDADADTDEKPSDGSAAAAPPMIVGGGQGRVIQGSPSGGGVVVVVP